MFSEVGILYSLDTLGVENFDKIALSPMLKEIEAILYFRMAAIFENFFKSGYIVFLRYPGGRKFRRNRSISNGLGDRSNFVFATFHLALKWPSLASELKAKAQIVN